MNLSTLLTHVENTTGAVVNLDAIHPAFYSADSLALAPGQRLHRGAFCEFAKRHTYGNTVSCTNNKTRSRRKAYLGKPFCGVCPFGLQELAWPVKVGDTLAATLYLGHFLSDRWKRKLKNVKFTGEAPPPFPADPEPLEAAAAFVADFIRIEIDLWQASGQSLGKHKPGTFYRDYTRRYIEANYSENIRLADMAEALGVSPNYLSAKIREECGKPFATLLTDKRLEVARTYLEFERRRSITDIAYLVGYQDSNYFSTVFRKHMGISPKAYRFKKPAPET